jgi:hypothetical protein
VHLSSHEEADDLGFHSGARAYPCKLCKVSTLAAKIHYQIFFYRLHRLSVCLHASLTEVAVAFFTEALLGLTGMLQLQAKAKAPDVSTILKSC